MRASARILVVDDESLMLEATTHLLRRAGHLVATAETGSDALRLVGMLAQQLQGALEIENRPGATARVAFAAPS